STLFLYTTLFRSVCPGTKLRRIARGPTSSVVSNILLSSDGSNFKSIRHSRNNSTGQVDIEVVLTPGQEFGQLRNRVLLVHRTFEVLMRPHIIFVGLQDIFEAALNIGDNLYMRPPLVFVQVLRHLNPPSGVIEGLHALLVLRL